MRRAAAQRHPGACRCSRESLGAPGFWRAPLFMNCACGCAYRPQGGESTCPTGINLEAGLLCSLEGAADAGVARAGQRAESQRVSAALCRPVLLSTCHHMRSHIACVQGRDAQKVDDLARSLELLAGPVVLTWSAAADGQGPSTMALLQVGSSVRSAVSLCCCTRAGSESLLPAGRARGGFCTAPPSQAAIWAAAGRGPLQGWSLWAPSSSASTPTLCGGSRSLTACVVLLKPCLTTMATAGKAGQRRGAAVPAAGGGGACPEADPGP
jgi:hypothetical protein